MRIKKTEEVKSRRKVVIVLVLFMLLFGFVTISDFIC